MDKYGLAIYNENRVKKRLSTYLDCGGLASVIFRSDGAAGTGRGSSLLSAFEDGRKIHVRADWRSRAGTPGVQRIH